ncbi:MAG TPA: hypothetical protein VLI05_05640 [Candidatus Saccharimonadia bacterium]|nr:hypothetical protein [Candidatus Saccharimonadia bacterium]
MHKDIFSSSDKVVLGTSIALMGLAFSALPSSLSSVISVRLCLIASIIFFALSFSLTTWWQPRKSIRSKLADQLSRKTQEKFVKRMTSVHEDVHMPLNTTLINAKMKDLARGATNESDFNFKVDQTTFTDAKVEKSFADTMESMLIHMQTEGQDNYRRAFLQPLNEPAARLKFLIDLCANKTRYYLYALGIILLVMAAGLYLSSTS